MDNGANNHLKCCEQAQEVSDKTFSMLSRNWSCNILVKEMATFCPCLKSLPESIVKIFWINSIARRNLKTDYYILCHVNISGKYNEDL